LRLLFSGRGVVLAYPTDSSDCNNSAGAREGLRQKTGEGVGSGPKGGSGSGSAGGRGMGFGSGSGAGSGPGRGKTSGSEELILVGSAAAGGRLPWAVSQLPCSGKSGEEWFSLRENHEKACGSVYTNCETALPSYGSGLFSECGVLSGFSGAFGWSSGSV
jgi:hypothetical protein